MDRVLTYSGAQPLAADLARAQQFAMIGQGFLAEGMVGPNGAAYGLACTPTTPAGMNVFMGRGFLAQLAVVDGSNPGSSAIADGADPLLKIGINLGATTISFTAPTTSGQSQAFLIQGQMQESDGSPVVLPYYNASNPQQPYLGPNNQGGSQNTVRAQRAVFQVKSGTPASTGNQATPTPDNGWLPLAVVTIAAGTTQITASNISAPANAPYFPNLFSVQSSLNAIPGQIAAAQQAAQTYASMIGTRRVVFANSGVWVVPDGVYRIRMIATAGGGGASGCQANGAGSVMSGANGGAGDTEIFSFPVTPGQQFNYSVGAGGTAGTGPNSGQNGGDTTFSSGGSQFLAHGGQGGQISPSGGNYFAGGGRGGAGSYPGGDGGDGQSFLANGTIIMFASCGGASYWGGGAKASQAGSAAQHPALSYGAGGGAPFDPTNSNTAYTGGAGANGTIVVEY